jgi:hypothetical protein
MLLPIADKICPQTLSPVELEPQVKRLLGLVEIQDGSAGDFLAGGKGDSVEPQVN